MSGCWFINWIVSEEWLAKDTHTHTHTYTYTHTHRHGLVYVSHLKVLRLKTKTWKSDPCLACANKGTGQFTVQKTQLLFIYLWIDWLIDWRLIAQSTTVLRHKAEDQIIFETLGLGFSYRVRRHSSPCYSLWTDWNTRHGTPVRQIRIVALPSTKKRLGKIDINTTVRKHWHVWTSFCGNCKTATKINLKVKQGFVCMRYLRNKQWYRE